MMDPAVRILAKAMFDVVDKKDERKEELSKTMRGDFNELDLRSHYDGMSPTEKVACSDRAENIAEAHTETGTKSVGDTAQTGPGTI
jgi:hypothetical protein